VERNSDRRTTSNRILVVTGIIALVIVIIVVGGYAFGWEWTGFSKRKLWDWLQLLVIPVVLAAGGFWFNTSPTRT
jgi:hypothetical protein